MNDSFSDLTGQYRGSVRPSAGFVQFLVMVLHGLRIRVDNHNENRSGLVGTSPVGSHLVRVLIAHVFLAGPARSTMWIGNHPYITYFDPPCPQESAYEDLM